MIYNTMENSTGESKKKDEQSQVETYMQGLSEQERMVMKIAEQHLETSFDVTKSIGFLEWKKSKSYPN